jgi:excisionase family DNA binding protein
VTNIPSPTSPTVVPPPPAGRKLRRHARPATPPDSAKALTKKQVAELLQICVRSLERLIADGAVPGRFLVAGAVRFRRAAIEEWIAAGCPRSPRRR